jgi:hypothetical protein
MIMTETEVAERLESPLNLLNRLRSATNKHSRESQIPSLPPSSTEIIKDLESKIAFGSIKSKAAGIMTSAMDELKARLPEVQKPEKLAAIAADMGKIVNAENNKNRNGNTNIGQILIYCPQRREEDSYNVIDVSSEE